MSYRNKRKTQIQSHQRVLSYDITKHLQKYQNQPDLKSSSNSISPTNHNFNSRQSKIIHQQFSNNNSQSQVDSDNETENFIRAEFTKYQVKPTQQNFKLFKANKSNRKNNTKSKDNVDNNAMNKQENNKKQIYQKTFFEIQIQDKDSQPQLQQQFNKPVSIRNPSRKNQRKTLESSGYLEIEQLQRAIMGTLRQKEKELSFLSNQLFNLNQQKLLSFTINQQLQKQLFQVKKKSLHVQKIKQPNGETNWKPQTVEQMKILIQNQRLADELVQLQREQLNLKALYQQITDQQTILRETLESTFRTRKDYIKAITADKEENQNPSLRQSVNTQNTQVSRQTLLKPKLPKQTRTYSSQTISKFIKIKQKSTQTKQKTLQHSHQIKDNLKSTKQPSQMKQKELLLQLLQKFNELKNKVDESMIIQSKNNCKSQSYKSAEIKPKIKVVYNNL